MEEKGMEIGKEMVVEVDERPKDEVVRAIKESLLASYEFRPLRREPEPVVLELKLSKKDVEKALKNFREETIKALDEAIDKCRKSMLK
jgi:hypothetical protein